MKNNQNYFIVIEMNDQMLIKHNLTSHAGVCSTIITAWKTHIDMCGEDVTSILIFLNYSFYKKKYNIKLKTK